MPLTPTASADLIAIVGVEHARDQSMLSSQDPGVDSGNLGADLWLRPRDCDELSQILRYCNAHHIGVVPQGGRTGLSGGATSHPGEIIVALDRFTDVHIDPVSRTALVGAGVKLSVLADAAARFGLSAGIDLGARDSATIGGLVSTNAGGIAAFKHGTMRERVLGLEAVLADGRVLSELGQVVKRNEGLAVERLLIGAEGTLGVITRVSLSLVAIDGPVATALVAVPDLEQATQLVSRARSLTEVVPTALEVMSGNHADAVCRDLHLEDLRPLAQAAFLLLIELTAPAIDTAQAALLALLEEALESGLATDAVIAQNEAQRITFWRVREDWAVDRERPGGLWYDVSVPLSKIAQYVQRVTEQITRHDSSLSVYVIGHLADGNLHVTINAKDPITARYDEIAALVTSDLIVLGGSYSAEHGIGHEKKKTLERWIHPTKRELMRGIKALLDPHGILNRGKVIPD